MTATIPLPASVRDLVKTNCSHPGLYLDKFVPSRTMGDSRNFGEEVQSPAVNQFVRLSQAPSDGLDYAAIVAERREKLRALPHARTISAENLTPLAIHLARGTALENAGMALHPVYGCAHLPGTGLKGLAHAYACEVWFAAQGPERREEAWSDLCEVFGTAPSPWLKQLAERLQCPNPKQARTGGVVFHDGWGSEWPKLQADVVTSHHPEYYAASATDRVTEPGDWENPNPVGFPVIAPRQTFEFTLSTRRDDTPARLLDLAELWLLGGLTRLGFGGKTNAGYGRFRDRSLQGAKDEDVWKQAVASGALAQAPVQTIELVAPAFIGGLNQFNHALASAETMFRSGTLRGQLRAWWRTMHAAHLTPQELRRLETFVWGDVERGGAVKIAVVPTQSVQPQLFDRKTILADPQHEIEKPNDRTNKTAPGLQYHSYGMDDHKGSRRYLPADARAEVTIVSRDDQSPMNEKPISAAMLVEQALAAFRLFAEYGGWGAKSGRGFGSFRIVGQENSRPEIAAIQKQAAEFRRACGLSDRPRTPKSPSLEHMIPEIVIDTPWKNVWHALDRIGMAAQLYAKSQNHRRSKTMLGMPRTPEKVEKRDASGKMIKYFLDSFTPPPFARHNGPIRYRLRQLSNGTFQAVIAPFIAAALPDYETSKTYLQNAALEIAKELKNLIAASPNKGRKPVPPPFVSNASGPPVLAPPKAGDLVRAKLSQERTKKGTRIAEYAGLAGTITNSSAVPDSFTDGAEIELIVNSYNGKEINFRYEVRPPAGNANSGKNPKMK